MSPVVVKLYTRNKCPLCDIAKDLLLNLQTEFEFILEEVDIYQDDRLIELYGIMIPVVEIDGEEVQFGQIDPYVIRHHLKTEKLS